jgi:twitching motility two-component system response regulator PilH
MNETDQTSINDSESHVLSRLGRDISGPLEALLEEIHALDASIPADDGAARLVELAYDLQAVVEPLTAFARLEAMPPADELSHVDLRAALTSAAGAPDVAPSFRVTPHGDLGTSFGDRVRFERGLGLCLRLLSRMIGGKGKSPLHLRREVHQPSDRVVLTTEITQPEPVALALLKSAAKVLGATIEIERTTVTLGFFVGVAAPGDATGLTRPVLAFPRGENASSGEPDAAERAALILVVDDEPAARAYVGRLLELEGFEVVSCSTLEQAHEAVDAYRPDVVILDRLQLEREGSDWIRRFRGDPALGRTPLVLMQSAESESFGLVSVSAVVSKPIDPNEVVATIERLTGAGSPPMVVIRHSKHDSKWQRCLEGQARVVTALDVSEGERVLDTLTPRILIVDVRHVEGSMDLLEKFRRGRGSDVPVVAVHGRLSKKARLRLDAVADVRLTHSELSRRCLDSAVRDIEAGPRRTELGAG